jgi:hypothetical protein
MITIAHPTEIDQNGEIKTLTGLSALRQKLKQRLSLFLGTWFLDSSRGVPYFTEILTKPVDSGFVASIISEEIKKEPEVTEIVSLEIDFEANTRKLTYKANLKTIHGDTTING